MRLKHEAMEAKLKEQQLMAALRLACELRKNTAMIMPEVYERVAMMPAPRFYVDYMLAVRMVHRIEKGKRLPISNRNKVRMYREIHRRWKNTESPLHEVLRSIIEGPAPEFYIDGITLYRKVCKFLRERREKHD